VAAKHDAIFRADATRNLVTRLHQNVLRTGLRRIRCAAALVVVFTHCRSRALQLLGASLACFTPLSAVSCFRMESGIDSLTAYNPLL